MHRPISPAVLLLFLVAGLPAQAEVPDPDGVCDGDEPSGVECEVLLGPSAVTVKEVATAGVGYCQDETVDVPSHCESAPGDIGSLGMATFGDPSWGRWRVARVNVVLDQGTCTQTTSPPCGFTINICNDRDQDGQCLSGGSDEFRQTAASQGVLGDCKDETKWCDDPNEAGWEGCLEHSVHGNWTDEQVMVFVGVEAGASLNVDVQAAVSFGTYTVWFDSYDPGHCDFPSSSSSGCIWTRDVASPIVQEAVEAAAGVLGGEGIHALAQAQSSDTPSYKSESCDDRYGNPVWMECDTAGLLVVLHVGLGQTAATSNTCTSQNPQTATTTSPFNAQAVTNLPGTFQCHFTWFVAGAGACLLV